MVKKTYLVDNVPGSLSNIYEIKVLICCVINEIKVPFTTYQLNDVLQSNETVNYFNFCQAIKELIDTKHIIEKKHATNESSYLYITELGKETAKALRNNLPKSTIEKTIKGIKKVIEMNRQNKNRTVLIKEQSDGYIVKLVLEETVSNLMDLELFCPTEEIAKKIKDEMESKTTDIYKCILAILGNDDSTIFNTASKIRELKSSNDY